MFIFAEESCQSVENKMALFNLGLFFLDSERSLFKIDDQLVVSKLQSSEPSSAGLHTEPVGSIARYDNLIHHFLFKISGGHCLHRASKSY